MQKKKSNTYFTLNGKAITYSFYWKVVNRLNRDHYRAKRLFYRARNKTDPIEYIEKLINNNWHNLDTVEMDYNKAKLERWIAENIDRVQPEPKRIVVDRGKVPERLGNLLKEVL